MNDFPSHLRLVDVVDCSVTRFVNHYIFLIVSRLLERTSPILYVRYDIIEFIVSLPLINVIKIAGAGKQFSDRGNIEASFAYSYYSRLLGKYAWNSSRFLEIFRVGRPYHLTYTESFSVLVKVLLE